MINFLFGAAASLVLVLVIFMIRVFVINKKEENLIDVSFFVQEEINRAVMERDFESLSELLDGEEKEEVKEAEPAKEPEIKEVESVKQVETSEVEPNKVKKKRRPYKKRSNTKRKKNDGDDKLLLS
jgi:hypothetical protein